MQMLRLGLRFASSPRPAFGTRGHREYATCVERATPPAPSPMSSPHFLRPPHISHSAAAAAAAAYSALSSSVRASFSSGTSSRCRDRWGCCADFPFPGRCAVLGDGRCANARPCLAVASGWPCASVVGGRRAFMATKVLRVDRSENGATDCGDGADKREDREKVAEEQLSPVSQRAKERRQRGTTDNGFRVGNLDLLNVPGVGPANLRKLVEKGIGDVAELKQLYKDKFHGKPSEKMVEFLQSSVGIIHKNHAESIATFVQGSVDEDLKEECPISDAAPNRKKRLTFCVEGNISVGKTTFLQNIANETLELRDLVEVVPEPISKWQDVGPNHFNILDAFYAEPQRYAYTFQNYVFVTRVMQERESSGGIKPLRLMERSVFSDRMVFVRAVHEAHWMNEMEISIYDSWFDPVVSCLPGLIPDAFIYLRANPDTCHKRLLLRRRSEEGGVNLNYLQDLHEKHESWFFPSQHVEHLSVRKRPVNVDSSVYPDIRDRVFYLEGAHMHSSIQKVPALVLDCDPDIDFSKDIDAKRQYARQVAAFFDFVKKNKEISPTEPGTSRKLPNPQIVLPREGGLWMPKGGHLSESALESLCRFSLK